MKTKVRYEKTKRKGPKPLSRAEYVAKLEQWNQNGEFGEYDGVRRFRRAFKLDPNEKQSHGEAWPPADPIEYKKSRLSRTSGALSVRLESIAEPVTRADLLYGTRAPMRRSNPRLSWGDGD